MKKIAIAVAAAMTAATASAADFTLYGIVDTGLGYTNLDTLEDPTVNRFEMINGYNCGSRFGFKGTEDLGNGYSVSFVLENGFNSDSGVLGQGGRMFGREALVYLEDDFGKVGFGRMGILNSTAGSFAIGNFTPWGTGWGAVGDQSLIFGASFGSRWDNMISYRSPEFAGFQVHAQYSFGETNADKTEVEGKTTTDRYYAIGATYKNGPFAAYLAVDSINYATFGPEVAHADSIDDSLSVTLGGSYDFEVVKVYLGAQYFDEVNATKFGGVINDIKMANGNDAIGANDKVKGYAISLTGDAPLAGGKAMFGVGYLDAEQADSFEDFHGGETFDFKRYVVSVGYDYPFSKRTDVYAVASYMQDQVEVGSGDSAGVDADPSAYTLCRPASPLLI